jgi:hypothetical protein
VGVAIARGLIGALGVLMILGALAYATAPLSAGDRVAALFMAVPGLILVAGVLLERTRYRSLHAELTGDGHGPGGGETGRPDGRFRATDERFVDPTSQVPMRVWVDPATGERRYVAER